MYVSGLSIENIRCFAGKHTIDTSKTINILVGNNNAGKSTVLKSIYHLQGYNFLGSDKRIDTRMGRITVSLETNLKHYYFNNFQDSYTKDNVRDVKVNFYLDKDQSGADRIHSKISMTTVGSANGPQLLDVTFDPYQRVANKNLIYPYFSNRKLNDYDRSVIRSNREKIESDLRYLNARIDYLSTSDRDSSILYRKYCSEILGYFIGSEQDETGKHAAFAVDNNRSIPITAMGDGVPNILGLITDLCIANDQIFLIEEPENDIHPKALKALLKLIEEKSVTNQFFISTHSNVVVRLLGATQATRIFQVTPNNDFTSAVKIPESTINEVPYDSQERLKVLEDLGYDVFDYALWKGWLFLEESSAETIINEFLIPNFVGDLSNKIKTFSARGFDGIGDKFKNFSKLFVFAHLDTLYKNRAWVLIDAGTNESVEINKLKQYFSTWDTEKHFRQFSKHNFEEYYPQRFGEQIVAIQEIDSLPITSEEKNKRKSVLKKQLLSEVRNWYEADADSARGEFEMSAQEIIEILRDIEKTLA